MKAYPTHKEEGMDLRDYFAAKVIQAMVTHEGIYYGKNENENVTDENSAIRAYKIADKMMKARGW